VFNVIINVTNDFVSSVLTQSFPFQCAGIAYRDSLWAR